MIQKAFVRAFAELSATDVAKLAERLRQCIEIAPAQARVLSTRPYWKINGYQEICLDVHIFGDNPESFATITQQLGTGWLHQRPGEATWNYGEGATFVEPSIRWAHVEIQE